MYRTSFPPCLVEGPVDPVPYGHLGLQGAVPRKCVTCSHLFEGSCTRAVDQVQDYSNLDHGPCRVDGPTDPVAYEDAFIRSKVAVPRKCATCVFLAHHPIRGFVCRQDEDRWGDLPRSLDWGAWVPERPVVGLSTGRHVSDALVDAVLDRHEAAAVRAFLDTNRGSTIKEARCAYAELLAKVPPR